MEDINHLLDLPSPSNSYQYVYGDAEQYLDTNTSEPQSSVNSPVRHPTTVVSELGTCSS